MESFNIGRTISRAFSLIISTISSVGLFILVIQLISAIVQYIAQSFMMDGIVGVQTAGDPEAALAIFTSGWYWALIVLSVLLGSLSFAGSLHGFLKAANRDAVSIGDCVSAGLAKLLPVLGLTILWFLGVGLGWILLIVPGVILITMWSVALPALVGENLGIFASFGRSRALTKGSRMMIFLTLLIFLILIYVVLFGVLGAVIGGGMIGIDMATGMAMESSPAMALVMIPFGWLSASLLSALLVSIYLETMLVKEGGAPGHLTQVFD